MIPTPTPVRFGFCQCHATGAEIAFKERYGERRLKVPYAANSRPSGCFQAREAGCLAFAGRPFGDKMKSEKLHWMRYMAGATCLAVLFFAQALWSQETKEKVTVDDVDRNFMVRLPKGYDAQQHYPVVILLHGMNQDPEDIERLTRFNELADKDGIIAVYPFALHGRWNVGVRPQERGPTTMGPGRGGRRGGGGYPGGGGGYPGGGVDTLGARTTATSGWSAERGETGGSGR